MVDPTPPTCGLKNRAATDDKLTCALSPRISVSVPVTAKPGIFELCHSIGKVIGVAPSTLKSYALCVYFQMYSPDSTNRFPMPCCKPACASFRKPGLNGAGKHGPTVEKIAFSTASLHPVAESTRFSLNGVSCVRAYETRSTVPVFFTL